MASAECSAEDCNRLVFEAVNEISVSKFNSIISSYSQIEVMTSLAKCDEKGETPLVIAMKGKNDSLIDELVWYIHSYIQLCDRKITECHVMSQIAIDQIFHHQIPIMELIEYLTKDLEFTIPSWSDIIAQAVFKSTSLSRPDKITALELIGASQLPKSYDCGSKYFAVMTVMFRCWREAMTLRFFPPDGEPLLPKIPYVGVQSVASSLIFGPAMEVMSMEQLNLIEQDFERKVYDSDGRQIIFRNLMRLQSLFMIRRISSQASNHWPSFYIKRLYDFCTEKVLDYVYNIDRSTELKRIVFNTYLLILEQFTGFDPQLLPRQSFDIFMKSLGFASRHLALLTKKPPGYPGREDLSHANLLAVTKFIDTIAKRFPNPATISTIDYDDDFYIDVDVLDIAEMTDSSNNEYCYEFADVIYDLVVVLACIPPQPNNQDKQQTEEHLSDYIRNYFAERQYTPLHVAVDGEMTENLELIKLIIKLGADPNATDWLGGTPLLRLAERKKAYLDVNLPMFQALVDAGTRLDIAEDSGETVLDIVKKNLDTNIDIGVAAQAYFSSLRNFKVFPLSCYCARVIRRHRIPIDGLPLRLQTSL